LIIIIIAHPYHHHHHHYYNHVLSSSAVTVLESSHFSSSKLLKSLLKLELKQKFPDVCGKIGIGLKIPAHPCKKAAALRWKSASPTNGTHYLA